MPFGVEYVTKENLKKALKCYEEKIPRLLSRLNELIAPSTIDSVDVDALKKAARLNIFDEISSLQRKIDRLKAKRKAVIEELQRRKIYGEPSTVHHTTYYIDYVNGDDSNDGLSPSTAWKTIPQYTTNTVRSPGDVCYVRRNQTHSYSANIEFDEDGEPNNPIVLRGDDGTGWSGDTDVRPVIDFGSDSVYFYLSGDLNWKFIDLDIKSGASLYGNFRMADASAKFYNCRFRDCSGGNYGTLFTDGNTIAEFENCSWENNTNNAIRLHSGGYFIFKGCNWDGNGSYGLYFPYRGRAVLIDCDFGVTSANDTDIYISGKGVLVEGRNVTLNSTNKVAFGTSAYGSIVKIEDYNGTKDDNRKWLWNGQIIRDTSVVRSGGADSSARVEPNSNCGSEYPIKMFEFVIWAPNTQKTYSVYMRASGWSSLPTSSECYIEAEYYDQASGTHKATATSSQSFSANDTWTEFSVTVTPGQEGILRLRGYLKKYESGAKIYVDIKPVVS